MKENETPRSLSVVRVCWVAVSKSLQRVRRGHACTRLETRVYFGHRVEPRRHVNRVAGEEAVEEGGAQRFVVKAPDP